MIKYQLVMVKTPIIVSNEKIMENDFVIDNGKVRRIVSGRDWRIPKGLMIYNKDSSKHTTITKDNLKVVAGFEDLPSIDWNGLGSEFGYVDVEELGEKTFPWMDFGSHQGYHVEGYVKGFKRAQELNDKKFSLDDLKEVFEMARDRKPNYGGFTYDNWEDYYNEMVVNNSLSGPKVFNIEVKIDNDCEIKILRKL